MRLNRDCGSLVFWGLAILAVASTVPGWLFAVDEAAKTERGAYVPGEVLVKFQRGAWDSEVAAAATSVGAMHLKTFPSIGVRHWRLGKGLSVEKALEVLAKNRNVEYAEPNYIVTAHALPDDPLRGDLWGLHNVGQTGGTFDADVDAPEAWDIATDASDVIVGVIDTGIAYNHPDLAANMWTNSDEIPGNGTDDDGNGIVDDVYGANFIGSGAPTGNPMDDNGHGSHTAGTIGAVGDNGVGVVGVNWHVQLMALKFLNGAGQGDTADAVEAVEYAAAHGARVTNNSWGGGNRSRALEDAIQASGALFVASAGNSHSSRKQYPGGYALDNVIAVAATDHNDNLASFSNYGSWVHLAAPGVDTLSCVLNDGYSLKSGTSMASPHVAGAAALVLAHQPAFTNAEIKAALLDNVDVIPSLTGLVATGGRLNVFAALGGFPPPVDTIPPAPVTDLTATATGPYSVALSFTATGDDGTSEQAALYDLRYATESITAANWDAATPATGEPLPQPAGFAEMFTVDELDPATTYYFALEVMDEVGNASGLSNLTSATTEAAPPSAWTNEVIDTSGRASAFLDFHDGPGPFSIGCSHPDGNSVVMLLYNGAHWLREIVDINIPDGSGIDFAFAPDGTPSVSYGWGKIKFAWRNNQNGTWNTETIEKGPAYNDFTALAYDPATGEPTVAYRKGGDLRFARKVGGLQGTWQVETVRAAGARYQDLVYDLEGHPVIAFSDDPDGDGWLSALRVATKDGSTWNVVTLHEGVVGYGVFAAIAIDADGDMIAADRTSGVWVFRKPGIGSWDAGTIVGDGAGLYAAFDGAGTPYVVHVFEDRTFVTFDDGSGWRTELVQTNSGGRADIRRDPQGGLGVVYGRNEGGIGLGRKPLLP